MWNSHTHTHSSCVVLCVCYVFMIVSARVELTHTHTHTYTHTCTRKCARVMLTYWQASRHPSISFIPTKAQANKPFFALLSQQLHAHTLPPHIHATPMSSYEIAHMCAPPPFTDTLLLRTWCAILLLIHMCEPPPFTDTLLLLTWCAILLLNHMCEPHPFTDTLLLLT